MDLSSTLPPPLAGTPPPSRIDSSKLASMPLSFSVSLSSSLLWLDKFLFRSRDSLRSRKALDTCLRFRVLSQWGSLRPSYLDVLGSRLFRVEGFVTRVIKPSFLPS